MLLFQVVLLALFFLTPTPASADQLKIGVILAETGPASFLGGPAVRSLRLLENEINGAGGISGNQVQLIFRDSGGTPEKAVSFARQLIEEEKVFAIIGPSTSGETLKIKKICEDAGVILISCASAELIVKPVTPFVFKTAPTDSFAARRIFMTMNEMSITSIAVLTGNTGFGKAGKDQMVKIAPEYGIKIVENETYDKSATDLTSLVAKIKANPQVQAVVNWSIVPAQSIIAKNIRQAGWNIPIFQSHGFANIKYVEAAGAAAEGIIFPASRLMIAASLPPGPQKDFLLKYKTDYETKYGENVSTFGGHAYDAMLILKQAIETAGTDPKKIRDAIENIKGFYGTAGEFNFTAEDHCGLGIDAFTMLTVKDGKFAPLK
ncbi:MAG: ABC transporter substrate-binding protein [Proteobacteria bacterium]|nr:ABC transporter substrate-binding protein [Pseudomonadota bacterium]MBU0965339.1 ABC transporter substrate-binding protein [Pseudomonadota bacterium]